MASNNIKVIIADDNNYAREMYCKYLNVFGYEVRGACDGFEVLRILKETSADFLLLDVSMPGMRGDEVLRELRKFDQNIEVFVCSAYDPDDIRSSFEGLNVKEFLNKPVGLDELVEKLKK